MPMGWLVRCNFGSKRTNPPARVNSYCPVCCARTGATPSATRQPVPIPIPDPQPPPLRPPPPPSGSAPRPGSLAGPTGAPPRGPGLCWGGAAGVIGPSGPPPPPAASVSAVLPAAPAYIPPTSSTALPASSVANCERPCGNNAAPGAQAPVTKPEIRLAGAVSLVARRVGLAPRPPPGGALSATPPHATTPASRATPPP